VEAVGTEVVPVRLVRDRDALFGAAFDARVENLGIRQLRIAARSSWQNGFVERWVGTLRRELLDHVIVLGERHLRRSFTCRWTAPSATRGQLDLVEPAFRHDRIDGPDPATRWSSR
jgi:transposase InsO family protein